LYYLIASPLLRSLKSQINPAKFNGASLLGLQGIIVKSHGNALVEGFYYAIEQAIKEVNDAVPELISRKMSAFLEDADIVDSLTT
jgi:glycerol-3-phosphate acyltransferase PlsX